MATASSSSRVQQQEQQPFAHHAEPGSQIPGMGQYRVHMDMSMSGMDDHFSHSPGRVATGLHAHHQQQQYAHPQQHHQQHGGQFGILAPTPLPQMPIHPQLHQSSSQQPHVAALGVGPSERPPGGTAGGAPADHRGGHGGVPENRLDFDPPDLQAWREKLFNVDELIVLTNAQYAL